MQRHCGVEDPHILGDCQCLCLMSRDREDTYGMVWKFRGGQGFFHSLIQIELASLIQQEVTVECGSEQDRFSCCPHRIFSLITRKNEQANKHNYECDEGNKQGYRTE